MLIFTQREFEHTHLYLVIDLTSEIDVSLVGHWYVKKKS